MLYSRSNETFSTIILKLSWGDTMELLLLFAFILFIMAAMIPNVIIQRAKLRIAIENIEIATQPRTWYDDKAAALFKSNRSHIYQLLSFVVPIIVILVAYIVWILNQFPQSNWPPLLIVMICIHVATVVIRITGVRWIEKDRMKV